MPTVLLVDDEQVFRAVEGTCLRRERARLVKAVPEKVAEVARSVKPDLIVASYSDASSRRQLRDLCSHPELSSIPILALDLQPTRGPRRPGLHLEDEREAPLDVLQVKRGTGGAPDLAELDPRLEAALKRRLPWMLRVVNRVPIDLAVRCAGATISGTLRSKDLSATGLFLKTARPPAPGRRFEVSFRLPVREVGAPAPAAGSGRPPAWVSIAATCEVVRRVLHGERRGSRSEPDRDLIPGMGVRFVELGPRGRAALRRFVHAPRATTRVARRGVTRSETAH